MHKGLINETATLRTIIRSPIILTTDPEMVEDSAEIGLELLLGGQFLQFNYTRREVYCNLPAPVGDPSIPLYKSYCNHIRYLYYRKI